MRGELFGQRPRKVLIIVDNQYIARVAHTCLPSKAYASDLGRRFVNATGDLVHNQNLPQNRKEKTRKPSLARLIMRSDAVTTGVLVYRNLQFP